MIAKEVWRFEPLKLYHSFVMVFSLILERNLMQQTRLLPCPVVSPLCPAYEMPLLQLPAPCQCAVLCLSAGQSSALLWASLCWTNSTLLYFFHLALSSNNSNSYHSPQVFNSSVNFWLGSLFRCCCNNSSENSLFLMEMVFLWMMLFSL